MDSVSHDQLKAWLAYFEDLGLSPFYTDRASLELPVGQAFLPVLASAGSQSRTQAPASASLNVLSHSAAPPSAVPLVAAPSLFDSVDRVEY